ncbi:MAG: hypothetical protein WCS89_03860 [Candidatus Paceibacterota bacterium]
MNRSVVLTSQNVFDKDKLVKILESHKVNHNLWGRNGWRSLDDLIRYMTHDQVTLSDGDPEEKLTLNVYAAVVLVLFSDKSGDYELFEEQQINERDGRRVVRNFRGIAETMRQTETVEQSARRCLSEELGFANPTKYELSELLRIHCLGPVESEKWAGLRAIYHRHIFLCKIGPELHRKDGYTEVDNGWKIYFKWRPRESESLI